MVKYLKSLDNSQPMTVKIVTNAAVVDGDLLAITLGLVGPATAADAAIIGIAMGDAESGAEASVLLINPMSVLRVNWKSSVPTKLTLVAADKFGTAFDWIAADKQMDLDDVTGGIFKVVGYDNTAKTADVVVDASALWTA